VFELERLSDASRRVLENAQGHSRQLGHVWIGTEHLLLALVETPSGASAILAARGLTSAEVADSVEALVDEEHAADRAALASLSSDLDRVREAIEADQDVEWRTDDGRPERWWKRPRRNGSPILQLPFTRRAKKCLELAWREAIRLNQRTIQPEHILLGVLRDGNGLAAAVLSEHGIDSNGLRADLETSLRASA
jgi:ATP-dependent Clp protease ATP-binding subunit ClpA